MGKGSTLKKIAIGTAIAGAAGYVVGVLSAPNEGKKTRQQLKKSADRSVNSAEKQLKELHTELMQLMDDAKKGGDDLSGRTQKQFTTAVDRAKDTKDKLREVLSSLHEGEASDKELQSAVEDAKRSLEHLKKFFTK